MPEEQNENTQENSSSQSDFETGSITVKKNGHFIHCLTIIGQIEGHYILPSQNKTTKYEHVIPQLVAIEESAEIEGLLIILNTVGGDVEAGLAIAELRSSCCFMSEKFYCAQRNYDGPSRKNERTCVRGAADPVLF